MLFLGQGERNAKVIKRGAVLPEGKSCEFF